MRKRINKLNRKKINNLINFFIQNVDNECDLGYNFTPKNEFIKPYTFIYLFWIEKKLNLQNYSILKNLFYRLDVIKKGLINKKQFYTILKSL